MSCKAPLGGVLPVGIHYEDRIASHALLDMYQADGDRPLMPEIAAQPQYSDGSHGGELRLKIRRIADLTAMHHRPAERQAYKDTN